MRLVSLAIILCAALAACQPAAEEAAAPTPEELGQDEPGAPLPQVDTTPVAWEAMSTTASSFTGPITISKLPYTGPNDTESIRIEAANGLVYEADLIPGTAEDASLDWAAIIVVPEGQPAPPVSIYAVTSEIVPEGTPNGGLCEKTFALALAYLERDSVGETLTVASFGGETWPPADETALCGTFGYAKPPTP